MIKTYLIILFTFLYSIISFSQDYSNRYIVSASIGGNSSHFDEKDQNQYSDHCEYQFNLKAGYFLWKRSELGIYSGYYYRKSYYYKEDTLVSDLSKRELYIGPYSKTYFKIFKGLNFTMFVSAYYEYSKQESRLESGIPISENIYNLTIIPGLSYDITERLSVNLDIGEFTAYIRNYKREDPTLAEEQQKTTLLRTYTSLNEFGVTTFVLGFSYRIGNK